MIAPLTAVQDTLTGYGVARQHLGEGRVGGGREAATGEVQAILNARHQVTSSTADYSVSSASSFLEAATSSNRTFTVLLAPSPRSRCWSAGSAS